MKSRGFFPSAGGFGLPAEEFGNARVEASPVLRKVPQYRAVHWDVSQVLSDEPAPEPTPTEAQDRYSFLWRAVVPAPRV
jgi:hypothetical protein